jgi:hypothetical protein
MSFFMANIILEKEYRMALHDPSDINEHLDILKSLADEVGHITEMGTRRGTSTRAFLVSNAVLRAYDIILDDRVKELFQIAKSEGKDVEYIEADVLTIDIEETDLLFIDTWHCYEQLIQELRLHAHKARKYIAFHDTQSYGTESEVVDGRRGTNGLLPAIIHYLIENPGMWQFKIHRVNNNGLTVLERI